MYDLKLFDETFYNFNNRSKEVWEVIRLTI